MKSLTKILSALMLVFLMSCSKDGETGPQGPAGIDGNANVLYSDWFLSGYSNYANCFGSRGCIGLYQINC